MARPAPEMLPFSRQIDIIKIVRSPIGSVHTANPPSTGNCTPVMNAASSPAKKQTAFPTSDVVQNRPSGISLAILSRVSAESLSPAASSKILYLKFDESRLIHLHAQGDRQPQRFLYVHSSIGYRRSHRVKSDIVPGPLSRQCSRRLAGGKREGVRISQSHLTSPGYQIYPHTLPTAAFVAPYQTPSGRGRASPILDVLTKTPPPCF